MRSDLNLPLTVDRADGATVREQVTRQLREAISGGVLGEGEVLPSSRVLASRLGIARSTVCACYQELEGEGWIHSAQGAGTYVADRVAQAATTPRATDAVSVPAAHPLPERLDLRPGDTDPALVEPAGWRRAWRDVTPSAAPPPAAGLPELRSRLAGYLGSSRGLRCEADEIVVCSGTIEALLLVGLALGWSGGTVAVEDPGYPPVRRLLARLRATCEPVDATRPTALPDVLAALSRPPVAVYLTPSHQYPLGHRIPLEARHRLLAWSRATGAVLVEDDYDGEFRYDVPPLSSLAGLDPTAGTIYLGTMSKVLDPGLRLAYLRVPRHLLDDILAARDDLGPCVAAPAQQAVATLLRTGELARHIARVRRVYADRRRVLLQALLTVPGVLDVRGLEAGLHVVAELAQGLSAAAVVDEARSLGVHVADMDEFRTVADPTSPAIVLSYGTSSPQELRRAVDTIARCAAVASA